jgi:glycosyltransferase involved in cell wall biosynthesis
MKLVYITNRIDGPGGLERVLSIKASMLADNYDYDVSIITLNQDSDTLFYDFSPKISYHNINASGNPLIHTYKYIFQLRKMVKKLNPDVIAVCDDGLKGFFVPLITGKPCAMIYERHVSRIVAEGEGKPNLIKKGIAKVTYALMDYGAKKYDAFVVLTQGNIKEWKSGNIKVISNPLSFYPAESSNLEKKKVIAVGKHCNQKGYDLLLKIWKIIVEKHPDWILEIYGSFNTDYNLIELSKNLNIENNVKLFKPVKNIKNKFLEASIHVLSSRFEGFGMVIIEAMACGVPPISFDCPCGPSDIISNKEDGILVENGNIKSFSEALLSLIESKEKRMIMGKKAKQNVKRFLPENITEEWNKLFLSLTK